VTPDRTKRLRVGVLFGGRSGEHEVSLASAASVIRGLDPDQYEAVPIGITKDGHWLVGEGAVKMLPEVLKGGRRVMLTADPTEAALVPLDRGAGAQRLDVIFPVMHGTFGEDGTIQGMLELAGLPYVGAGVLGSAIGMDKDVSKRLCQEAGIPVVPWVTIQRWTWEKEPEAVRAEIEGKFEYPVFVKPATLGSSVGMSKVHNAEELAPASVPGEIVPHREFYDYTAKYLEDGTQLIIPAALKPSQVTRIQSLALKTFRTLGLSGMARIDFFLEKKRGKLYLNEANTIPGFTSISMYPKLWEASGISFRELIDKLIDLALEMHNEKTRTKYAIELPEGSGGALTG